MNQALLKTAFRTTSQVAETLTGHYGNYRSLLQASFDELEILIGEKKAKQVEAIRQLLSMLDYKSGKITGAQDAVNLMRPVVAFHQIEKFGLALLTQSNQVHSTHVMSMGGVTGTVVDIPQVLKKAIMANATAFIVAHNHPSGNLRPSQPDIDLTRKLKRSADIMGIRFLDHLILTEEAYFSFSEQGLL